MRRSIDKGLAECSAGVIVLSPAFFAKEWPQRELDALFSVEISGRARFITIWHQIGHAEVLKASPLLADRLALKSSDGVASVARLIAKEFPAPLTISGAKIAEMIEAFQYPAMYEGEAQNIGCQHRFLRMNAFKEAYCSILYASGEKHFEEKTGDFPAHIHQYLDLEKERLRVRHLIPEDVYLTIDEPVRESELGWWTEAICGWVSGTLEMEESVKLVRELDLQEFDEYWVLLGLPNFSISDSQRDLLELALIEIGCGLANDYTEVQAICDKLRASDAAG